MGWDGDGDGNRIRDEIEYLAHSKVSPYRLVATTKTTARRNSQL
jgi:hypothetical protein